MTNIWAVKLPTFIKDELELIKQTGESRNAKKMLDAYFKLSQTYHSITGKIKGIRNKIVSNKEKIVETIEQLKPFIAINSAIKIFNISRATYQNYKTLVLNKCSASYFEWCVKKYPQQLLNHEILKIKQYFENSDYQFWSKASLYFLGLRSKDFGFCIATFYKYAKLLGYKNGRHLQTKLKYTSLVSTNPDQIWCADVTIFKTTDGIKHYILFLMDHYSKKIIGYSVEKSARPATIKRLLENTIQSLPLKPTVSLVTDGGIENVNTLVKQFNSKHNIVHLIAQKDITFSNSAIEALNKIIKHQFLFPLHIENGSQLIKKLPEIVQIYNTIKPQQALKGNTPEETYQGKIIDISQYKSHFKVQKEFRKAHNHSNRCKKCVN